MCMTQLQVMQLAHVAGGEIEQPHTVMTNGPLCTCAGWLAAALPQDSWLILRSQSTYQVFSCR